MFAPQIGKLGGWMGAVLGICEDLGRVARLPASLGKRLAVKGSKPAEKGP